MFASFYKQHKSYIIFISLCRYTIKKDRIFIKGRSLTKVEKYEGKIRRGNLVYIICATKFNCKRETILNGIRLNNFFDIFRF